MEFAGQAWFVLLLSVPVACVVWTITQEELFREFREALEAYQRQHKDSIWRRKLAYLPTCPYCFSHYVAALFVLLYEYRMLADGWRGFVVAWLTTVLVTNVYVSAYHLLRAFLRRQRALADLAEAESRQAREGVAGPVRAPLRPVKRRLQVDDGDEGATVRFPEKTAVR